MKPLFMMLLLALFSTTIVHAAVSDGDGPWADEVISHSQGLMKNGDSVPAIRSNPESTIGVAEQTDVEGTFFSLGFGGSLTVKFNKGFSGGVLVIESTWDEPVYPIESAKVEVSGDGLIWYFAGNVDRDQTVSMPTEIECAEYVRITDIGTPSNYPDDIADGYDVDGVKVENVINCSGGNTGGSTPTPTPQPSPSVTPTPSPNVGGSSDNNDGEDHNEVCEVAKPGTPVLTAERTSSTTASLSWNHVDDATHYVVSYGTESGTYTYGIPNTGYSNSFVVGGLAPDTNYYFIVRAVNDCLPGEASNEVSINDRVLGADSNDSTTSTGVIGGTGQVLGLTTDSLANTGFFSEVVKVLLAGGISLMASYAIAKK